MKMSYRKMMAIGLALMMLTTGCASIGTDSSDLMKDVKAAEVPSTGKVDEKAIDAMADFASKLFEVSIENEGNVMISPTSVYFALAMAQNGADGGTKQAMLDLLGANGLDLETINGACKEWLGVLNDSGGPLSIANSIWFDKDFVPYQPFLQANADYYNAAARKLDFADSSAPDTINDWVNSATKGTIDRIVDKINPDVVMYLINAVYFKADWEDKFNGANTFDDIFNGPEGNVSVPFMNRTDDMAYIEAADATGVFLHYEGGKYGFAAILPREGVTPREWVGNQENGVTASLTDMVGRTVVKHVHLSLPKFESEYEDSLLDELDQLGMGVAFEPGEADFSMMNESHTRDLYISEVKHKTYVKLDEEGTEASAVTSVEVSLTSAPMEIVNMVFDRPFIYCIIDRETNQPIFMGIMENPAE